MTFGNVFLKVGNDFVCNEQSALEENACNGFCTREFDKVCIQINDVLHVFFGVDGCEIVCGGGRVALFALVTFAFFACALVEFVKGVLRLLSDLGRFFDHIIAKIVDCFFGNVRIAKNVAHHTQSGFGRRTELPLRRNDRGKRLVAVVNEVVVVERGVFNVTCFVGFVDSRFGVFGIGL